ncbi:Long-chain-fatty-acid--CoA ligase FadD13 [Cupriavidus laharis]|uniref:Long-chain-fatty-acid--CoA ligase FadD13 n=1 Tax=Cupriavidus laharis TaxID=151654 RepID=A0ABN7Y5J4_9BURK|nr:AMP-binding protein [Cupriavidus laharis]CAG9167804.1 Long-chain-fatty-acid--CoA ligase FadD13 [Cupriavidus laharis]
METLHTVDRLAHWAEVQPGKAAVRLVDGDTATTLTYAELDARASVVAQWLVGTGLQPGDGIALLMENHPDLFALAWGARRAGLYYTPVSTHLNPDEVDYILRDCGARLLVATRKTAALAGAVADWAGVKYLLDSEAPGFLSFTQAIAGYTAGAPLPMREVGRDFLYSSGTTGKPKGIRRPLVPYTERFRDAYDASIWREFFAFGRDTVYLTMAPLYHAAPLRSVMRNIDWGGENIVSSRFDAARALELIAQYRVTHSQWVPTMMIRMLALPDDVRARADLSSMRVAIHAAAPCPPDVKQRMIDWWGPVWYEYYGGSEGIGLTAVDSKGWLARPGTVGPALLGRIHIKDDEGRELPPGQQGRIWFSGTPRFAYHNDEAKTAAAYDADGCATFGDIGHVDEDGWLFMSGRRTDLILSGGVNIYPQEIENLLATYPGVADVAVIGVPHPEFGEEVKAVIELQPAQQGSPELGAALLDFCRQRLSHVKCPRSVDFVQALPRLENGKLYKRVLLEQYTRAAR